MFKKKNDNIDYENLNETISLTKKILKLVYIGGIIGIVLLVLILLKDLKIIQIVLNVLKVAAPFFIGLIIAWLLDPIVTFLEKRKVKRLLATVCVFILFLFILYLFFRLLLPVVYNQINDFVKILPGLFKEVSDFINNIFTRFGNSGINLSHIRESISNGLNNLSASMTENLPQATLNIIGSTVSSIGTFLLGLVVGFYLLLDFNGIKHLLDFIPKKFHNGILTLTHKINTIFKAYINGTLFVSLIIALSSWIAYSIIGLPSPLLFALICGLTNIIPYLGPWVSGAFVTIIGFTVSPVTGILTAVLTFSIQQIESMILQPIIMSKSMKLHPVTIVVGLLIFGYFFGVLGMILATPIMSLIKVILNYIDEKYDLLNKIKNEKYSDDEVTAKEKPIKVKVK